MSLSVKQALEATQILTHFVGKDNEFKYEFAPGVRTRIATRLRKIKKFQEEFTLENDALIKKFGSPKKDADGKDTQEIEVSKEDPAKYAEFLAEQKALLEDDTGFTFIPLESSELDNGKNKIPIDVMTLMYDVGFLSEPNE